MDASTVRHCIGAKLAEICCGNNLFYIQVFPHQSNFDHSFSKLGDPGYIPKEVPSFDIAIISANLMQPFFEHNRRGGSKMKKSVFVLFSMLLIAAFVLTACTPAAPAAAPAATTAPAAPAAPAATTAPAAPAATTAPAAAQQNATLEFWTFSDYATDVGGDLMKTFIAEFEAAHPGVKINMTGKGGDDLNSGIVSSATSNTVPDVYMGTTSQGALFTKVNALANVNDRWKAMPESYRKQLNPDMIAEMQPKDGEMWGLPFTGYATFLYRNLDVLKKAGVDTSVPITDWATWLDQMKKVKEAGMSGMGSFYNDWWDFTNIYSGAATDKEWGIDFANKKTMINPEKYIQTVKFLEEAKKYGYEGGDQDQATTDLFLSNKLAFLVTGPWMNPTFLEAKKNSNLNYDYTLIPGATADNKGGVRGTEFIGFAPNGKNQDLAWEFATYITAEPQLTRWTKALSRYNANLDSLSKVSDPLLAITVDSAKSSLMERPPHFTQAYPGNYYQELQDNLALITTGKMTPEEGAKDLVEKLNASIADQ
jgi:multiple sugar transport system substrate-binding protein